MKRYAIGSRTSVPNVKIPMTHVIPMTTSREIEDINQYLHVRERTKEEVKEEEGGRGGGGRGRRWRWRREEEEVEEGWREEVEEEEEGGGGGGGRKRWRRRRDGGKHYVNRMTCSVLISMQLT